MSIKKSLFATVMILAFPLCLTSPTKKRSPMSSDISLNLIKDTLTNGTRITKRAIKLVEKNLFQLNNLIEETNANILKIESAMNEIELKNINITKEYLDQYFTSKAELREARMILRQLAEKTVTACKDIKDLIEFWDDKETAYIAVQFDIMKQLVIESGSILEKVKGKYNNAINAIHESNHSLQDFSNKVNRMTMEESEEYEAWTTKVRGVVNETNAGVSVGLVIADALGCLGSCSALGSTLTWTNSIEDVETAIADYKAEMEKLVTISKGVIQNIEDLNNTMDEAIIFLNDEIKIIIKWEAAAENVDNKINNARYSPDQLKRFAGFLKIFVRGVDELQNVAQSFLDRPTTLDEE